LLGWKRNALCQTPRFHFPPFCLFPGAVCRIQRAAMGSGLSIFRQNERCPEMPLPSIFSPAMLSRPVPGENFLPSPGVLGTGA